MSQLPAKRLREFMEGNLSDERYDELLSELQLAVFGGATPLDSRVTRALVAIEFGNRPETVATFLDWKDFEGFCAALMRSRGYAVLENVRLKNPTAQIDVIARSPSICLAVDCKHWSRELGRSALSRVVSRQKKRVASLRRTLRDLEPVGIVVVALGDEQHRFVEGGAVVPLRTLPDFLDNLGRYTGLMDLC